MSESEHLFNLIHPSGVNAVTRVSSAYAEDGSPDAEAPTRNAPVGSNSVSEVFRRMFWAGATASPTLVDESELSSPITPAPGELFTEPGPAEPPPEEPACTCRLVCEDLEDANAGPVGCILRLWSVPGSVSRYPKLAGAPQYTFNPLVGHLELLDSALDVNWEVRTSSPLIQLTRLSRNSLKRKVGLPGDQLSDVDPCKGRISFAIEPTAAWFAKHRSGDMTPQTAKISGYLNGSECDSMDIELVSSDCDLDSLAVVSKRLQDTSPDPEVSAWVQSTQSVSATKDLGTEDEPAPEGAVVGLRVKFQATRNCVTIQANPDCCCEYFFRGFAWAEIDVFVVEGNEGAANAARLAAAELLEFLESDEAFIGALRALMTQGRPRCYRSATCPTPDPEDVASFTTTLFLHQVEVNRVLSQIEAEQARRALVCSQEAAAQMVTDYPNRSKLNADSTIGLNQVGSDDLMANLVNYVNSNGLLLPALTNTKLAAVIYMRLEVRLSLSIRTIQRAGQWCWCVVRDSAQGWLKGRAEMDRQLESLDYLDPFGRIWAKAIQEEWASIVQVLFEANGSDPVAAALPAAYITELPACYPSTEQAEAKVRELLELGSSFDGDIWFEKVWCYPVTCGVATMDTRPIVVNARGMLDYKVLGPFSVPFVVENEHFNTKSLLSEFLAALPKESDQIPGSEIAPCCILVWVHGINNSEDYAVTHNLEAVRRLYTEAGGCCYVVGYLWNGDPANPALAWTAQKDAANVSAMGLAKFLEGLRERFPNTAINIAGHSLGCRVILEALQHAPSKTVNGAILFNAAVPNNCLNSGGEFSDVPKRINGRLGVVYDNNDEILKNLYRVGEYFEDWSGVGDPPESRHRALGETGPDEEFELVGRVSSLDVTQEFAFEPSGDQTHHSALYEDDVSRPFFNTQFPAYLEGESAYCERT